MPKLLFGRFGIGRDDALFLKGAQCLGADFHRDFLAIDDDSFGLEIWFPYFLGVALREADIAAVLLAFAGEFTDVHTCILLYVSD